MATPSGGVTFPSSGETPLSTEIVPKAPEGPRFPRDSRAPETPIPATSAWKNEIWKLLSSAAHWLHGSDGRTRGRRPRRAPRRSLLAAPFKDRHTHRRSPEAPWDNVGHVLRCPTGKPLIQRDIPRSPKPSHSRTQAPRRATRCSGTINHCTLVRGVCEPILHFPARSWPTSHPPIWSRPPASGRATRPRDSRHRHSARTSMPRHNNRTACLAGSAVCPVIFRCAGNDLPHRGSQPFNLAIRQSESSFAFGPRQLRYSPEKRPALLQ